MSWSLEQVHLLSCDQPRCENTWDCMAAFVSVAEARGLAAEAGWTFTGAPGGQTADTRDFCPEHSG
jgi:hypothetical protein